MGAYARHDTCGEAEECALIDERAVKPFVAIGDGASLDETLGNANAEGSGEDSTY